MEAAPPPGQAECDCTPPRVPRQVERPSRCTASRSPDSTSSSSWVSGVGKERALSAPKVETDEGVLVAHVEEAVRQRGIGSDNAVQDLRACDRTKRLRRGGRENHFPGFA